MFSSEHRQSVFLGLDELQECTYNEMLENEQVLQREYDGEPTRVNG